MTREIKYQAWLKKEQRMISPVVQIHLDHMPYIGWYETTHDALEGKLTTAFMDEVEMREYTGLKDKNGKEIYEGDVLNTHYEGGEAPIKGIVFYSNGAFKVTSDWVNVQDYTVYDLLDEDLIQGNNAEVIGNIYEHPHLLK